MGVKPLFDRINSIKWIYELNQSNFIFTGVDRRFSRDPQAITTELSSQLQGFSKGP